MFIVFKRFSEYLTLKIDRENKKLFINGEQTNYKETEQPWRMLWDKCEEHKRKPKDNNSKCKLCMEVENKQDEQTRGLSDDKFVEIFKNQMEVYGFHLKKWES